MKFPFHLQGSEHFFKIKILPLAFTECVVPRLRALDMGNKIPEIVLRLRVSEGIQQGAVEEAGVQRRLVRSRLRIPLNQTFSMGGTRANDVYSAHVQNCSLLD